MYVNRSGTALSFPARRESASIGLVDKILFPGGARMQVEQGRATKKDRGEEKKKIRQTLGGK